MHRNVTRLLPRAAHSALRETTLYPQQCRTYSLFDRVNPFARSPSSKDKAETTTTNDEKSPVDISLMDRDPKELKRLLEQLDQKALVDTKVKLQELRVRLEGLRTGVPGLFPKSMGLETGPKDTSEKDDHEGEKGTSSNGGGEEDTPYILAHNRTLLADLPAPLTRATKQIAHLIAHIQDLQTADYAARGDRLAGWKEEISGMSRREKEEKLVEMQYEEEAMLARMVVEARKNLGVVEGLRGVAREGEGRGRGQRVLRVGERRRGKEKEGEGGAKGGKKEGEGKEKEKEKPAERERSLSELQANLNAEFTQAS